MANSKNALLTFVLLFFVCASISSAQEEFSSPGASLTLKDAILIAFKNNKDIQIQQKEILASSANIMDARSKFLPTINLEASYFRRGKVFPPENIFTGFKNDNSAGLTFAENVYNGGANLANYKQAKLNLDASAETLFAKKLDVEFDAKRIYYGLLLAYESERIAKETLEQAKAHLDNVQQLFAHGRSSHFDVLQSQVQMSLLVPDLVNAQNEIDLLKAQLNKLLSRKVDTPITTDEKLNYTITEVREADFLKTAYLDKPEMKLSQLGVDISRWSIQMAKSGYRPQIDLQGEYSYRSGNLNKLVSQQNQNWSAGVSVNIPIFEGFSTKAKVDEAKARYSQSILSKDNLHDQIAVDVKSACLDLNRAFIIIESQKDNVNEAREALRISEVSYENGVATNLDVLDSQTALSTIQKNLASAIYDYLLAQAQLDRTMGRLFVKEETK